MTLSFFVFILSLTYLVFTAWSVRLWYTSQILFDQQADKLSAVSVLVIGRNEEMHIQECLQSIAQNSYPKDLIEIIFIDDHSEDDTVIRAQKLRINNLKILHLSNFDLDKFDKSYKKAAQYYGILAASHELIIQTDADCVVPKNWLSTMTESLKNSDFVTGPIKISNTGSFMTKWQTFENIGTMVLTFVGISVQCWYSANAANMAYRKDLYLDYFRNNPKSKHASGDDIFLINWARKKQYRISFLLNTDAIVDTFSELSFKDLYHQRARWATKTTSYKLSGIKGIMSGLFLFHLMIFFLFIVSLIGGVSFFYLAILSLTFKWIGDSILLYNAAPFFDLKYDIIRSPIFSLIHCLYVVQVGLVGLFVSNYRWKGRKVK